MHLKLGPSKLFTWGGGVREGEGEGGREGQKNNISKVQFRLYISGLHNLRLAYILRLPFTIKITLWQHYTINTNTIPF